MPFYNRTCVPGPMFNVNFPRNNVNINIPPERPPMPSFQRPNPSYQRPPKPPFSSPSNPPFQQVPERFTPSNPPFQQVPERFTPSNPPFQQVPERFTPGAFQERSGFSHFSNPFSFQGFRNRPPSPEKSSPMNMSYANQKPRFGNQFERTFRPWNPKPPFQMTPRQPFQNWPRAPVRPYSHQDFSFQTNNNKKQKTKVSRKLKDDGAEKPFSCDTCDRAFVTEGELNNHFSEHVKCESANCMFEAHPKIVALHRKMQHETGYADAINKLQDHAEIQKWREERRNRFPTAENILKRKAEQVEKEARGEVLETKEFGKYKRQGGDDWRLTHNNRRKRRRGRWNSRFDRRHSDFQNRQVNKPVFADVNSESDSDDDSHISLSMFSGLSAFAKPLPFEKEVNLDSQTEQQELSKEDDINAIADDSVLEASINESEKYPAVIDIADSDNEGPTVVPIIKHRNGDSDDDPVIISRYSSVEELPTDDVTESASIPLGNKIDKNAPLNDISNITTGSMNNEKCSGDAPLNNDSSVSGAKDDEQSTNGNRYQRNRQIRENPFERRNKAFVVKKSTLLEKLLADDIRHERNVILQCVRHIVNNKFFGVGN